MGKSSQFLVSAALLSMQDAKIDFLKINTSRVGVYEGTSLGGLDCVLQQYESYLNKTARKFNPFVLYNGFIGAGSGDVAIALKLEGPSMTVCTGSAASTDAIGLAYKAIKHSEIDVAVAGGAEAPILLPFMTMFCQNKLLSTDNLTEDKYLEKTFRPFDKNRNGFFLSEGAGVLILEEFQHAKKRGAFIYGEIIGYGKKTDAYHITSPHPDGKGIIEATNEALDTAKLKPKEIDYINAHGTGTILNDKIETKAIKKVFGDGAYKIPISSTKPLTGHLLGASGAIEIIICLLAIKNSFIPPTHNYMTVDPECDLDYVPNKGRESNLKVCLSYSYGFGGKNSALIIKKIN
jgi:3-oxoacyl-[acyl-carrier-protein] synthase II